jgi:hypothetical protein
MGGQQEMRKTMFIRAIGLVKEAYDWFLSASKRFPGWVWRSGRRR